MNEGESVIHTETADYTEAMAHLLAVIRELGSRSELIKQLLSQLASASMQSHH